jgi:PIN domain nuclease of toxin-antitoxin system
VSFLLDTHLLLWIAAEPDRLPDDVRAIVDDATIDSYFSVASLWEVTIKTSLNRPDFAVDGRVLRRGLLESGFPELGIDAAHVLGIADLPDHHRDPFDRLLVSQARMEGIVLLTVDASLGAYGPMVRVISAPN